MANLKSQVINDLSIVKWAFRQAYEIDKKNLIFWIIINISGAVLPVLFLLTTKKIINIITEQTKETGNFGSIVLWISILVGFAFVTSIYQMLPSIFDFTLFTRYAIGMQKKMANAIRRLPLQLFDDAEMATQIDMTMPTIKRLSYFLGFFLRLIGETVALFGLVCLAASTSMLMLGFALLLVVLAMTIGFLNAIEEHRRKIENRHNERLAEYYYTQVFNKELAMEYRMLSLDRFIRKRWFEIIHPIHKKIVSYKNKATFRNSTIDFIGTTLKFSLIIFTLKFVGMGHLTIGAFIMLVAMFEQIVGSSSGYGRLFMNTYSFLKDFELQKAFFELDFNSNTTAVKPNTIEPATTTENEPTVVFELKDVSFSYNPGRYALKDVSMKILKGERIALVGGNGAGKSTLVKVLLGFYKPTSGELFFEGESYDGIDLAHFSQRIGVIFQDYAKFEFTLRENIAFGDLSKLHDDPALYEAAAKGGATKLLKRNSNGLDAHLGRWYHKNAIQLSGGEWQRIAVSRAHISDRDILIMDEPAAMLDPISEMEQFHHIKCSLRNRTSILISHRIGFARLADKIAVLDEGQLVEFGTHEVLMERQGKYYQMFTSQAEWYQEEAVV